MALFRRDSPSWQLLGHVKVRKCEAAVPVGLWYFARRIGAALSTARHGEAKRVHTAQDAFNASVPINTTPISVRHFDRGCPRSIGSFQRVSYGAHFLHGNAGHDDEVEHT